MKKLLYSTLFLVLLLALTSIFTCSANTISISTTSHSSAVDFPRVDIYKDQWAHLYLSVELSGIWIGPNTGVYYHGVINFSIQVEANSSSGVVFEVLEVLQDEWSGDMEFQLSPGGEINLTYNHIDTRGSELT
ncbi:MAG: hypothetical protein ACTSRU_17910 [Candidatus Hodarchaeales archaeon]